MKYAIVLFGLVYAVNLSAQKKINYFSVREELRAPLCGIRDSAGTAETYSRLLEFDTTRVRKHMDQYYADVAEMEYLLFMYTGDAEMLRRNIKHSMSELSHNQKSFSAMWSIAFSFHLFGKCEEAEKYLAMYEAAIPRRMKPDNYNDKIALLRSRCRENHDRIYGAPSENE